MDARQLFRDRLDAETPVYAPVCLEPLWARMIEDLGYGAAYLSGGGLGYSRAISEALLTIDEVATVARQIVTRSSVPLIVDGGIGFGDAVHMARTIWEIEATGAAAIEIEDQVAPKRVSHHRGVEHLVPTEEMVAKIEVAVEARTDPDFLVIARTGAVRNESFDAAIERCEAYHRAGADLLMLFPSTEDEWRAAPERLDAPLAAMTMFGGRSRDEWADLGWALVIDPFSGQVAAFEAARVAYRQVMRDGTLGRSRSDLFGVYEELAGIAGLEDLYDIERATTEPGT